MLAVAGRSPASTTENVHLDISAPISPDLRRRNRHSQRLLTHPQADRRPVHVHLADSQSTGSDIAISTVVSVASRWHHSAGGSRLGMGLIEVVIAVGLLVTLAAGVVHLFAMSARSMVRARHRTSSLLLAVDKIEQLRAGVRTARTAMGPSETRGLQIEYLDVDGRVNGRGRTPSSGSMYAREWSVWALPGSNGIVVLRVTVAPIDSRAARNPAVAPDGARLVTLLRAR